MAGMTAEAQVLIPPSEIAKAESYRQRKETTVLAIVFADVIDSIRLLEDLGDDVYLDKLDHQLSTAHSVLEQDDGGKILEVQGDGFLAVFAEPSLAVERCVELAERDLPLPMRFGIDMGQVARRSQEGIAGRVLGRHVYRAARVQGAGSAGSVVTTFPVYDCAVGWLRSQPIMWSDLGEQSLKGFEDPVRLYQAKSMYRRDRELEEHRRDREVKERPPEEPVFKKKGRAGPPAEEIPRIVFEQELGEAVLASWKRLEALIPPRRSWWKRLTQRDDPKRPRLLWVDDHPEKIATLMRMLDACGWPVDHVTTTESAMEHLDRGRYAAVISDMHRGDDAEAGFDLLRRCAEAGRRTPILIYCSVANAAEWEHTALELGAAACTSGTVTLFDVLARELENRVDEAGDASTR